MKSLVFHFCVCNCSIPFVKGDAPPFGSRCYGAIPADNKGTLECLN